MKFETSINHFDDDLAIFEPTMDAPIENFKVYEEQKLEVQPEVKKKVLLNNNLKEVDTILKSEAVLAVSPTLNAERQAILETIQFRIQSVLKGRNSKKRK